MQLIKDKVKRLGIYFFFDKEGIVDNFVTYFLEDLMKSLERLIVVCNGELTPEGWGCFRRFTDEIIVRENRGLDVWAYKTVLNYVGWKTCETFDEIVLCNSTSMGPVYPFVEMFSEMQERDVDFWGITKTHEVLEYDFGCNPYGYLPEHVQSYFIVYRKSLVQSIELQKYWNEMPEITSYDQSVGLYESTFTKMFADKGFRWDVYVNTDDLEGVVDQPLMFYPLELIKERRCPVFKRRTFFHNYADMLIHTLGQPAMLLYDYLVESGNYDVNMIWDNLLRCYNLYDVAKQMHLNYTLSTTFSDKNKIEKIIKSKKIALIMHLYFEDMFQNSVSWVSAMPKEADVYITTNTEEKKMKLEKFFNGLNCQKLEIRVVENRGRDVSALLVGMQDIILKYDLVCFSHDKKSTQTTPGSVGESFGYKCYTNILYNKTYVENIINLFEENPRMGMVVPPPPNHGDYYGTYGKNWSLNFENTKELCEELGVIVPMSEEKEPIAPFGSVFWFKPKAMRKLFEKKWKYEDFPEEPLLMDGTLSHAIERCYQFVAQSEGYYSALVMSDKFARIEYSNLNYYITHNNIPKNLEQRLEDVYKSTSWKISKPIRILGELIKNKNARVRIKNDIRKRE